MQELPRLTIQLDGIKQNVAAMLAQSNNEINEMVVKTIEEKINEGWVQEEINQAVVSCLKKAIANVANDYALQQAITRSVSQEITKMINKDQP